MTRSFDRVRIGLPTPWDWVRGSLPAPWEWQRLTRPARAADGAPHEHGG